MIQYRNVKGSPQVSVINNTAPLGCEGIRGTPFGSFGTWHCLLARIFFLGILSVIYLKILIVELQ